MLPAGNFEAAQKQRQACSGAAAGALSHSKTINMRVIAETGVGVYNLTAFQRCGLRCFRQLKVQVCSFQAGLP